MLFIQSNNLAFSVSADERLRLLAALRTDAHPPLIGSLRQRCYELLLAERDETAAGETMTALARQHSMSQTAQPGGAYLPGELFCADDCIFFLVFGAGAAAELSAGVIYSIATTEPLNKLARFCQDVRAALDELRRSAQAASQTESADLPAWRASAHTSTQGLARFIATQPTDFAVAAKCRSSAQEIVRASELLAAPTVRQFLRRVQEMRREGYTPRRMFAEASATAGVSVRQMLAAGLLEREVRVSCRQSGHALFDLPTPDSLAAITISKAKCSLCAAPVADEVIEETINPTRLAVMLLSDGHWLINRVYKIIRALGLPDSEIATGPVSAHGESYLAADVCGQSFLFVTKDGDLTPAFSRRIAETVTETAATRLVVVITGTVEDEGRLRLYEFTWRRARDGQDLDTTISAGLDHAQAEIARAFERAIHHELARQLCTLDAALGLSAGSFVLNWFKLLNAPKEVNEDHAARLFEPDLEPIA